MSTHTEARLETRNNAVIAYFAPNETVQPNLQNELFATDPVGDRPTIARDNQRIRYEITLQGHFEHSTNLPQQHASDLQTVFGESPVTARMQINRIKDYMLLEGGPYNLYLYGDEYTKTANADVDPENGVFPTVQVKQFRPPEDAGLARAQYTLKLVVGVPE